MGSPITVLQTIDSTNKYAMGLIHAGMARHGEAVFALAQPEGKGQWGKKWSSEPGANILLSVIIKPGRLKLPDQFYFNAAMSLAVYDFFSKYAGDETTIKWPNDLYWRDRKAGGILIESVVRGSESGVNSPESAAGIWEWAVVGIGININQTAFPDELINPVSLKQITGQDFDPLELAKELCVCISEQFDLLVNGKKENIYKRYNQHLYKLNEQVKLKKDNRMFEVIIKGVSPFGKLMTTHAFDEEFGFGEVEWVI
jgi:BirA family transcriptional regulator, biotin operon repressor / biotin---[acetyl-CoA-carboxylase] ligase